MSLVESIVNQNSIFSDPFPPMDWKETSQAHVFQIELPGLTKEDVKLQVHQDRLVEVSAERKDDEEEGKGLGKWQWHCRERRGGNLCRQFRLPQNANVDEIKASMCDGVLVVTAPKHKQHYHNNGKKEVEISSEDSPPPKGLGRFVCCRA